MFAIAFLFFILLYLFISYFLATGVTRILHVEEAKKRTMKIIIFLFMISLVMWDWIPMEISFRYKCLNEAGLTVNKTLEQWKQDNPRIAETLNPDPKKSLSESFLIKTEGLEHHYLLPDGTEIVANYDINKDYMYTVIKNKNNDDSRAYWLNQRFASEHVITQHWFHIYKQVEQIVDTKTNKILAKRINFGTNIRPLGLGKEFKDFKFWMQKNTCWKKENKRKWLVNGNAFSQIKYKLRNINGVIK